MGHKTETRRRVTLAAEQEVGGGGALVRMLAGSALYAPRGPRGAKGRQELD